MSNTSPVPSKITLAEAIALVHAEPVPYATLFEREELGLELFIPNGPMQSATHAHDELYLVQSGAAILDRAGERISCGAGDVVFVPSNTPHRFDSWSAEFRAWVLYVRPQHAR
ncbi:MAG TPA: cupin domain-containing protein [Steroidobacter sp.]|jgi:mannose-6-phosphate isomerase-like protein (cupin superfamily)|nr:cupin domain-containing protein [Steroidobacter sp.]